MKIDDYVEYNTPEGYLLRVNMRSGTFLAFRAGKPQSWWHAGIESQIHPMLHAIFLGDNFRVQTRLDSPLIFFPMERGFVKIPFEYGEESDTRFMRIPQEYEGLDFLPGLAFHFSGYWPNVLPAIGDGRRYFITDQGIPRQNIMRIKAKYPRSRLIVFKPEDFMKIRVEREKIEEQGRARAVDLVEDMTDDTISQNPVFAARYFLRSLEWRKMYSIPMFTRVKPSEIEIIISFLEKMYKSAPTNPELEQHTEQLADLVDYYDGVQALLTSDFSRVKSWQRKHQTYKRAVLSSLIATCEFQRKFALLDKNLTFAGFLRDVFQVLKDIPSSQVAA
ncbi:MAG TPA: hypothetical protein PKM44_13540 [Turneriella sp.]|nr:hypothetical protein [Turneriella sp.]HNJ64291.1 hypothetical protein [Turneriella sp.]HNL11536.1 hypothetical protein [Turneriella sp.]